MNLNPVVQTALKNAGIETEGMMYLLSLYHKLPDIESLISEESIRKTNSLAVVERDYKTKTLQWNVPLYEGGVVDDVWEWVNEYRALFAAKNKEREGVKRTCLLRMKEFFRQYPHFRKEDVLEGTKLYMRTCEPQYCKMSHKFIFEGSGVMKDSQLAHWCDVYQQKTVQNTIDPNTKLMK